MPCTGVMTFTVLSAGWIRERDHGCTEPATNESTYCYVDVCINPTIYGCVSDSKVELRIIEQNEAVRDCFNVKEADIGRRSLKAGNGFVERFLPFIE